MKKYGIIGYPLGHSFSPSYFNEKFQNENIDAHYDKFEIPVRTMIPTSVRSKFTLVTADSVVTMNLK